MEERNIIARNIKRMREASNYTQDGVATFLGIGRSAYSNYESGSRSVPLDVMEGVAKLFGVDLSVLFEESEESLKSMLLCAYRAEDLSKDDMKQVASAFLRRDELLDLVAEEQCAYLIVINDCRE